MHFVGVNARIWKVLVLVFAVALITLLAFKVIQMKNVPPPFVYRIPADFFGPVVTLFGQSDGVEMKFDVLGHAVDVPQSGIVKIRRGRSDVMGVSTDAHRATHFVSVDRDGKREPMKLLLNAYRQDGVWRQGVLGSDSSLVTYEIGNALDGTFNHLPVHLRRERVVTSRENCKYRFRNADPVSASTDCDEFVVASPNELLATGHWLWGDFASDFSSTQDFLNEVSRVHVKKTEYLERSALRSQ